jgi:hypothetical protein
MNSPPRYKALKTAAGYLLAAACLVWVFHDVDWKALAGNITAIDWRWVVLGVLFDVLSYVSQGYRWHILLKPLGRIGTLRTTQAIYSGLFLNEILPMRLGEIARGYLVSVWMSKRFVAIIPSMFLERLFEGIWMAIGIGVTAIFVPLPRNLVRAGDILGLVVLVLTGIVFYLTLRKKRSGDEGRPEKTVRWKPLRRLRSLLDRLEGGFRSIGLSRDFYAALFLSLLMFAFQALAFWFIMKAYGLPYSFWVGAAVFLIVNFGTALPNTPANIGSYQLFCVLGLTLFGVEKTVAAGFSIVVFILLTIPLWAIGFFALGQSGMTLASIKDKIRQLRARE